MSATLLINSLAVALGAGLLALALGLVVALAGAAAGDRERQIWGALMLLNLALPPFLSTNAWLDVTAGWRALAPPAAVSLGSLFLTSVVLASLLWPVVSILVGSAWGRVQSAQLDADPQLRGWSLLRGVLIPLSTGELVVSGTLVVVLALANFTVPTLFQVRVFTEEFWIRFNTQFDWVGALRACWPLVVIPCVYLFLMRGRAVAWPRFRGEWPAESLRHALAPVRWPVRCVAVLWVGLSLGFPLGRLISAGPTWSKLPGAVAAGTTEIWNTIWTAGLPPTLTVLLGIVLSGSTGKIPRWTWLTFLIPGVFLGVALILLLNRPATSAFFQSLGILWLALGLRYLAPAWAGVAMALRGADPLLLDAARSLGGGRWRVGWLILRPQISTGVLAAWYVVYLLCLWDVETVVLLQPPGGQTLALRIFNLLHYGHAGEVNALCLVMLALALAPGLLWLGLRRFGKLGFVVASLGVLTGCGPQAPEGNSTPLDSRIFSRVEVLGSRGVAPGQFNKPRSLICDREDNLYVADITGRIQKFSPDGRFLLQWQMPQTDLGKPKGMALDRDGDIIVVEPHYMRVNHFSPAGLLVSQWGTKGTNAGEFILPRAVVQDSRGDFVLSEYTVVDRVQRFGAEAKDLGRLSQPVDARSNTRPSPVAVGLLRQVLGRPGSGPGEFNRAEGLGLGQQGEILVADSCNHRIQVFDRDGKFLRSYGRAGSNPGEFSYPYDVRVDANGHQYICEFGNSRITILDAQDQLIETVGSAGGRPGELANPWAIALDSRGNLYVADSQNHRVQKLIRKP